MKSVDLPELGGPIRTIVLRPPDAGACGAEALKSLPRIEQVFVNCPATLDDAAFNRRLYMARRLAEKACPDDPAFYIPSLSAGTIGVLLPPARPASG